MVELSKALELQNCAVWMPDGSRSEMILTHQLREGDIMDPQNRTILVHDPDVLQIKATKDAIVLGPESALGVASRSELEAGPVAAIRMPMLSVSNFKGGTPEVTETRYAILVLVLPNDGSLVWGRRELEIVEVVADQVAVALSHAALLEESQLMREKLAEQHRDLLRAKHEAMRAGEAWNTFQSAMYDGMPRPMHSILGLVSMMQQGIMNPEQWLVMDAIAKTSSVASTLMNDVMQTSTMTQEHLSLVRRPFNLHSLIKEAVGVVRCLAGCKGVEFEFQVDNTLPERIVGDEKRVFHIVLDMVGTLMNRCNAGCISLYVNSHNEVEERHNQDWMLRRANFSGGYVCVKFENRIRKSKDYLLSSSSSQISLGSKPNNSEMGPSFNMCKKIVQMMEGNLWGTLDGQGLPDGMTLVLRFQLQPSNKIAGPKVLLIHDNDINLVQFMSTTGSGLTTQFTELAQVEEPHSTPCKDVMAWVAMGKQIQKELNHRCVQKVGHKLLGRDDIRKNIMENILLDRNGGSKCTVICINGGSGLGKTSLLRVLYNDQELMDDFDKRIWIQMSDKYDILMLFRKIIEFSVNEHCSITNIDLLQELVTEEIANKKLLLFLDDADIEDQQFWTSVLEVLNAGIKGSAVVMVTRSSASAALRNVATHSYFLSPLSEENNLMLLQQYAFVGTDIQSHPNLLMISNRFITRFRTNPLNLKAVGGLLCHADSISLESLEMDKFEGNIMHLKLCHDVLPIHLKKCLAFCSLFPKGYIFDKHHIVLQWISHGCVRPAEGGELQDVGVEYFDELLCRSFFQYSPLHNDKDDKFVLHELVYKVLESVSRDRYFKSEDLLSSIPDNILHLSLVSSQFQTIELMSKTKELNDLQTFMVAQPEWKPYKIPFPTLNLVGLDDFFLKFTSIETLDLSHTDTEELPGSIGGLSNLQYLSVNNTSIRTLAPELCSLGNLQTLEAKDCRFLTELPSDTKKLLKLRHLDVTKELDYVHLPHGIGHLSELQTLPVFHASGNSSYCSISELGNLHNLRGCLRLSGLGSVKTGSEAKEANLKDKHHLKDLTLQWHDGGIDTEDEDEDAENVAEQVLESLQPHTNLQELAIRGYEGSSFPAWMQSSSSLPNLVSLTLDGCYNCTQFPATIHLPSLKFLSVWKMYDVKKLTSTIHGKTKFPSLELLNLWEMYELEELFEASEGDCPRLRKVCISRCPDLKRLPCVHSLTELVLHCGRQLPDIPELASLVSLKIEGFHGVRSFSLPAVAALSVLKKLEIRSCKELSSVEGLSALTTVQRLKVAGCPKLVLPRTDSPTI